MATHSELIEAGEQLVHHALLHRLMLPPGVSQVLLEARGREETLKRPGQERDAFYAALASATAAVPTSASDLSASAARSARLGQHIRNALQLLYFAAANAKKVGDDIRNPVVAVANAADKGTITVDDEQRLCKAYEALTSALAPVTADTLEASATRLPKLSLLTTRGHILAELSKLTLGRFVNAAIFVVIFLLTCIALGYYSLGSSGLARFKELHDARLRLAAELSVKQDSVQLRESALQRLHAENPKASAETVEAAAKSVTEARRLLMTDSEALKLVAEEQATIPERLWRWSQLPCSKESNILFSLPLCSTVERPMSEAREPNDISRIQAAKTVAERLGGIYLPLLLGWLGAHAYILRKMSGEIAQHSFAKASSLQHIIRIGLGALAGFASAWLLTPEVVGGAQLKNLPAWALAFIAGYGIELVFSFMDRIIGAFK